MVTEVGPGVSTFRRGDQVLIVIEHNVGSMLLNEPANFLMGLGHVRK